MQTNQNSILGFKYKLSLPEKLVFLLCFLGSLNFINRYYYWIFIAFFVTILLFKNTVPLNISSASLLIFAFLLMIFSGEKLDYWSDYVKPFTYLISYIIGHNLINRMKGKSNISVEHYLYTIVIVFASANLLHYLLNWIINWRVTFRNTYDFWTGNVMSATSQMSLACLAIGLSCAYIFSACKLKYKVLAGSILIAILGYNLVLAGRTTIVMIVLCSFIALFHYLSNYNKVKKLRVWIAVFVVALLIWFIYVFDLFGVQTIVENSNLFNRFFGKGNNHLIVADTRFLLKSRYIALLWDYPWGGGKIHAVVQEYAHDLLLDTYDQAGVLAFGVLVVFLIKSVHNLINVWRNKVLSFEIKQIILCTYMVIYMEFYIEPILAGMPWLFATFCLLDGAVCNLLGMVERQSVCE